MIKRLRRAWMVMLCIVLVSGSMASATTLSGRVYEGQTGVEPPAATPIAGVTVRLYGSYDGSQQGGTVIDTTTTDAGGWYGLEVRDDFEFFNIVQTNKAGYSDSTPSPAATSGGGTVKSSNWIQYSFEDLFGTTTGNKFWDKLSGPANRPPVAVDDSDSVAAGGSLYVGAPGVLANDSDPDGDPLTAIPSSGPSSGTVTLNPDGSFTYTPNPGFSGTDSFTYKANDGALDSNIATVTITVGDEELCIINVYKWEDKNGDCVWDADEQGLANWKICLDNNQNCRCDPGEPFKMTDATGWCWFDVDCQETYYLAEELQPGWERTCPAAPPCEVHIHTASPLAAYLVRFGNRQVAIGEEACCLPDGSCANLTPEQCRQQGGTPQGPGTACLGDLDGDGIDDICGGEPPEGEYDFGDAPDSYGTLHASGGPYHDVSPIFLGVTIDGEFDGQPDPHALGDDNDAQGDDEDGLTSISSLVPGQAATASIQVNNNGPSDLTATVAGWLDFGGNKKWDLIPDDIGTHNLIVPAFGTTPVQFTFTVPLSASPGPTFARFRLFRRDPQPGVQFVPLPTGYGNEGEVEDYEVTIEGEGPPGECTINVYKWNDKNGDCVWDADEQGLANWKICLDNNQNCQCDPGEPYKMTDATGWCWFDVACNSTYYLAEELKPGWQRTCPASPPCQVQMQTLSPEVVYLVSFGNQQVVRQYDFGDAPANYPSASHALGGPWLGDMSDLPDAEPASQPDSAAKGDDNDAQGDDEDGVVPLGDMVKGNWALLAITIVPPGSGDATVAGWIDYNRNGSWDDPGESLGWSNISVGPAPPGGWQSFPTVWAFQVPANAQIGATFARFRIYEGQNAPVSSKGAAGAGEVEDHQVQIKPDGTLLPPGGVIVGVKFNDLNGNGLRDGTEPPLANWKVYLDINQNGTCDLGEPWQLTDNTGSFLFTGLTSGTYTVAEELQPNWIQTCPGLPGTHTVSVQQGAITLGIQFGNQEIGVMRVDWGDAPDPYPTLQSNNGACHIIVDGIHLGQGVDAEIDGQPTPDALGDDMSVSDDEDGVFFETPLLPGQMAGIRIVASAPGFVDAWIDFLGDQSWGDPDDHVLKADPVVAGDNLLSFAVPSWAPPGETYARFRFSSVGGLGYIWQAPDGEVEDYHILIGEDGPYVPGEGEERPHLKWSQPPLEIDPKVDAAPFFCGWNEPARSTRQSGQSRQWRIDADDFHCLGPIPITRIRWWGGYKGWTQPEPPESQPITWHIGIWANQVEGLELGQLYPERLVWSIEVPNERVGRDPVGLSEFPQQQSPEMCFGYEVRLEPEEWFHQADVPTNEGIFWLSITAIYPPDAEQVNMWGWTTRSHVWGDGAVMPAITAEWPTSEERLSPGRITPIESSALCGQKRAYDLCFELLTEQPWIKWDLPFTGIREWPHYEDVESQGVSIRQEENIERLVADDWLCEQDLPVVALAWWGSYIGYGHEACGCDGQDEPPRPDYFLLRIWRNAPAGDAGSPDDVIWEYRSFDYDEVLVGYDKHPEGEPNEPVFRYTVRLPEDNWFRPENPGDIHWLSITAVYTDPLPTIVHPWGWTNHRGGMVGAAVVGRVNPPGGWRWEELFDQTQRPQDMSFTLFTAPALGQLPGPLPGW